MHIKRLTDFELFLNYPLRFVFILYTIHQELKIVNCVSYGFVVQSKGQGG